MSYALNQQVVAEFSKALQANEFGVEEEVTLEHIVDLTLTAVYAEGGVWVLASRNGAVWKAERMFVTEIEAAAVDLYPNTRIVFVKYGQSVHDAIIDTYGLENVYA